jgi:hypothetical protein
VAKFIEDHYVELEEPVYDLTDLVLTSLQFEQIDQFDGREEMNLFCGEARRPCTLSPLNGSEPNARLSPNYTSPLP